MWFRPRQIFQLQMVLGLILTLAGPAHSQKAQKLISLHEKVGPVIDASENQRYHLFGEDAGMIAAKVYVRPRDIWLLHIMGEKDDTPWMLVNQLNLETRAKLQKRLALDLENKQSIGGLAPVIDIEPPPDFAADRPVEIRLVDNTKLLGKIRACTPDSVQFETLSGLKIPIPDRMILDVRWPRGTVVGEQFLGYDPNHNRLFFGPTGRTLRAGEGNFADFYVFFPTVAVGMTDLVMLGGGVSLIPGADSQLLYFSPKVRVGHAQNFDMAIGFLFMVVPEAENFGAVYSAWSIGDPARGITLGVALPFGTESNDLQSPAFLFGAEKQVSSNAKLITENWYLAGEADLLLLSAGVRFFGERLTADIGLVTSPEAFGGNGFPFIPWVDFAISFGK